LLSPRVESRGAREVVKRIVNLDGIKGLRVVGEPLRFGQVFRAKKRRASGCNDSPMCRCGPCLCDALTDTLAPLTARVTLE